MHFDPREAYLRELGLTVWHRRGENVADVNPREESSAIAEAPPVPPAVAEASAQATQPLPTMDVQATVHDAAHNQEDYAAMDWAALEAALASMDYRGASRPVFGVGAKDAPLLIVGEAPGAEEDQQGEPFVGRAGKLLDRMLFAIGHDRQRNTYITNICKFRPPGNRDPNSSEVALDRPILERQIELIQPRLIIALGKVAAHTLLGLGEKLGTMRTRLHRYPGRELPVLVTYHPAYLLRSPQQKAKSWQDLKRAAHILKEGPE